MGVPLRIDEDDAVDVAQARVALDEDRDKMDYWERAEKRAVEQDQLVAIVLQPPLALRAGLDLLKSINVTAADGSLVTLSDLVSVRRTPADREVPSPRNRTWSAHSRTRSRMEFLPDAGDCNRGS